MNVVAPRYRSLSSWLKEIFGETVRKITIDAGLGCPNRDGVMSVRGCAYCNPRGSGTGAWSQGLSVGRQVDEGVEFVSRRYRCKKFIAYFQSFSNTYAEPDRLAALYSEAIRRPEIVGLAVGTRPDCVADEVLDLLAKIARDRLVWLEYGLQSIHERTLELINRGHGPEEFVDAVSRTNQRGIPVVAHLILGLPGETVGDMVETARAVVSLGVHGVKLHPLYVVRGTELERMLVDGLYRPMTQMEAAEATLAVLEVLPRETVIHRITSDPHPEELVAPKWMLDKRSVRSHLERLMQERNSAQGSRHGVGRGKV